MFVIAILKDEEPLLTAERRRLSGWAPANGWEYIEYVEVQSTRAVKMSGDALARV